jgi:hypothetical protein
MDWPFNRDSGRFLLLKLARFSAALAAPVRRRRDARAGIDPRDVV